MPTVMQQRTLGSRQADWIDSVTLQQIDPASGVQSITLGLTGTLSSSVSVYSLEGAASSFSSSDVASVRLERPDGTTVLSAGPSTSVTAMLPASVGMALPDTLSATASSAASVTYTAGPTSAADAALLIGTGTITLPVVATARITASAPGNFGAVFDSQVGATVSTVTATGGSSTTDGSVVASIILTPDSLIPLFGAITSPRQHVQIASTTTGWTQALGVARFDPSLGTLQQVTVTLTTVAQGSLQAENLDPAAAALDVTQAATVDLDVDGTLLDSQRAAITTNRTLGAFDGTIDGAGSSGDTQSGQAASGTSTAILSTPAALAAFTGGSTNVMVAGLGQTTVTGPGALSISASLQAGASIDVSYTYLPAPALFDASYYLAHNPDVAAAGIDPLQHYLTYGWKEGRDPSALFDTSYYLHRNPDVAAAGIDPLVHFAAYGWHEGRDPSLLFSDAKYLAANPDVAAAEVDPLQHYEQHGQSEERPVFLTGGTLAADPLIDAAYYDRQLGATLLPAGAAGATQAAWSYDAAGWQSGFNPNALFDTTYYLAHNPDVAAAHVDPLLHYETYGWKEGRDPSAAFSTDRYLAAYSDVKAAGMDPLLHYVVYGQTEGRAAFAAA